MGRWAKFGIVFLVLAVAGVAVPGAAFAKTTGKPTKQFTAEQKKKYYEEAVKACRKKYSYYLIRRVEVNWSTLHITCYNY